MTITAAHAPQIAEDLKVANRARRGLAEVARLRLALRAIRDEAETAPQAKKIAREALEIGMVPTFRQ